MSQMGITTAILALAILAFLSNRIRPAIVALGVAVALFLTGVNDLSATLAGFGDPIVIYLGGLFVVSEALDSTGVTAWAGQQLTRRIGQRRSLVLIGIMAMTAILSALISVNGAVAALVPVGVMLATRTSIAPSQLLIPLAFAAHAGSMLTLLGTPINLLVSDLAVDAGARAFGFFEFALVGVPMVVGVIIIAVLLGPRLLPRRTPESAPRDLSDYAERLAGEHEVPIAQTSLSYRTGTTEIVIPPRSSFLGDLVYPGMRTESGDLVITSVRRQGQALEKATLEVGDVLLLRGAWGALERKARTTGVLAVDSPTEVRRQQVHLGPRSYLAVAVVAVMCVVLASGVLPPAIVVLIAAGILVASGVVTGAQAQASISLPTILVVAGMMPLSVAIQSTGLADLVSHGLVEIVGDSSPHLLLVCIVALVLVLGQFLSNLATVLIVAPVAVAVAESTQVSVLPMMMAITVAGAASFLTPIATPANLMVQEPGAYSFTDYWKLGLPCLLLFGVIATVLVPLIWPF